MTWLDLRTGYSCNNRCRFCDQGDRRDRITDAPLSDLLPLLDPSRGSGLWLAGGEITLRPDLPRLIEAARSRGFTRVGLQTNGRILAAPGAADRLRSAGLTDATVALHAADAALHDWLVQAAGAHKQATIGVRRLVAAGVTTRINTVLTRSGTTEIPALAALAPRLGAMGHRWILARSEGADARMLVPRLALVREPLSDAIRAAWSARTEMETAGLPLCVSPEVRAAAADRLDVSPVYRLFPAGMEEAQPAKGYGPLCQGCPLRAACPGVATSYTDRYGWDEIGVSRTDTSDVSIGAPPPRAGRSPATSPAWARTWRGGDPVPGVPSPAGTVYLHVEAPCNVGCPGCTVPAWGTEPARTLRQRVVRAASEGATRIVFAGASPWSHPGLPAVIREARRLGFQRIEVWGPLEPLELDAGTAEKLAGLTRVRAPRLPGLDTNDPGLPCPVEWYLPGDTPDVSLYQASGPRAAWAACQRAEQVVDHNRAAAAHPNGSNDSSSERTNGA